MISLGSYRPGGARGGGIRRKHQGRGIMEGASWKRLHVFATNHHDFCHLVASDLHFHDSRNTLGNTQELLHDKTPRKHNNESSSWWHAVEPRLDDTSYVHCCSSWLACFELLFNSFMALTDELICEWAPLSMETEAFKWNLCKNIIKPGPKHRPE